MKQKYMISKSDDKNTLTIREFAEIDKEVFSLLCEETYDFKAVLAALDSGLNQITSVIRNRNFFPAFTTLEKISEGIGSLIEVNDNETIEVFIDDADILSKKEEAYEIVDDLENDSEQLDELLEDAVDDAVDDYDENISIKKINASIKVDEDELIDDNGDI